MPRKRHCKYRHSGEQASLTRNHKMRRRYRPEMALYHEQNTNRSRLYSFVSAKHSSELMLLINEALQVHQAYGELTDFSVQQRVTRSIGRRSKARGARTSDRLNLNASAASGEVYFFLTIDYMDVGHLERIAALVPDSAQKTGFAESEP